MAFTGFTQVGYITDKAAGTTSLNVPGSGVSNWDTVVVFIIHDNLGESGA